MLGGGSVALGKGAFVAAGDGNGGTASADRVGEGKGGLVFEFLLSLALRFTPPMSLGFSLGSGVADVLAD